MLKQVYRLVTSTHKLFRNKNTFPEIKFRNYNQYHQDYRVGIWTERRIERIKEWIKPGTSILDVGCGPGIIAHYFQKTKDCYVTGLDVSETAILKFKQRTQSEGYVYDLKKGLPLIQEYDYILLIGVLEHLSNPERILNNAKIIAKKGIIILVPNSAWLPWRLQFLFGNFPRQSYTHVRFWSISDFDIYLRLLNFQVIDMKTDLRFKLLSNLFAYDQLWLVR